MAWYAALLVPGGGCLSRAWLLEKQRERRKEGGEPPPRSWAKVAKSQKGRGREEHLPSPAPPPPHESIRKKILFFFIFQLVHQLRTPPLPPHTHTHRRGHTKTKGEVGGIKPPAQAHLSSMAWARGSPGPAASEREGRGRGFLSAPLPRSSLLQSRAAASLIPCAPGPRDSHHLPPAPAPSAARPGGRRSPVTGSPPPQLCKAPGANEERGPGKSQVLACKLYCNSSALFRRRQQNKV